MPRASTGAHSARDRRHRQARCGLSLSRDAELRTVRGNAEATALPALPIGHPWDVRVPRDSGMGGPLDLWRRPATSGFQGSANSSPGICTAPCDVYQAAE